MHRRPHLLGWLHVSAVLALALLVGCEGRFGTTDRGLLRGGTDAGLPADAGRIVLTFDRDAGPLPDAAIGASPDAWSPPPPSCMPRCDGRECGSDGCGGSCGTCAASERCSASQQCEPTAPPSGGTHMVTLYGASWCGACAAARAFFAANHVSYTERDVEDPGVQSELVSRANMLGYPIGGSVSLPVLVIDSTMTEGWSEGRVRGQLGL